MQDGTDSTDGSSIRPVSSLLSHFENMAGAKASGTSRPFPETPINMHTKRDSLAAQSVRSISRGSLDLPRPDSPWKSDPNAGPLNQRRTGERIGERTPRPTTPYASSRQRPTSMGPFSPARSPPAVTIDSPRSPDKLLKLDLSTPSLPRASEARTPTPAGSGWKASITAPGHYRNPSRPTTPGQDELKKPLNLLGPRSSERVSGTMKTPETEGPKPSKTLSMPPPINRAEKPKLAVRGSQSIEKRSGAASSLSPAIVCADEQVSPFSTPPSSDDEPPASTESRSAVNHPRIKSRREGYLERLPTHNAIDRRRTIQSPATSRIQHHPEPKHLPSGFPQNTMSDIPEHRPGLPPRREVEKNGSHAIDASHRSADSPPRQPLRSSLPSTTLVAESTSGFLPPPRRTKPSISSLGAAASETIRGNASDRLSPNVHNEKLPAPRSPNPPKTPGNGDEDSDEAEVSPGVVPPALAEYPDSSQTNRRRPFLKKGQREISMKYDARLFAICSEYVCTTGHLTRVWNTVTGELLMSLSHGETVKITSLAFKTTTNPDREGSLLWLGTNYGDIHEVNISEKVIDFTKSSAHTRREVIKIYRQAKEMWSLDDEGRLHVWPPDELGSPNLRYSPHSFRVPTGHTCSLVVGQQLWLACGKDIRVFQPSSAQNLPFQPLARPLSQGNAGEVTSATLINSQPDRVYFGHNDGKVTMYSRSDYACLGVVNVSLYKINSLSGVGDCLWAAYNTGMIYVYDTNCYPWKVKKDWHAHDDPVLSIMVDQHSIWKIDRLQVASFGVDNMIRLWDGTLQEDWLGRLYLCTFKERTLSDIFTLETEMQRHDVEYCDFREVQALVVTWNAGASKPTDLRHDEKDANFFRDVLRVRDPPDLIVFGFQELVDLEDKKLTAKSFFKGSKKKDASEHEHMSRQYRAWRDYLTRSIEEHMALDQPYHLLHTASMVGLFTCVFIKASERARVRNLCASEVKRGMGGLHGNKGALITRFVLDDTSFCFVNCHLAAGQSQTISRNNDVTAILECPALPGERDPTVRTDTFIGGGDGTMILDHEICILNGDLNYRIDTMGRDTVVTTIKQNNLSKLLERDQLLLSRKRNPAFRLRAFNESPITFAPTYKYDVGTDSYDTSEKRRAPAWCDRLLYRGNGRIKQLEYKRHELRLSDHRPVSGTFRIKIKAISPKKRIVIWERCQRRFEEVKQKLADEAK
ncbi:MAG: hypothetical protein M1812_001471 [Candelaria pacifica]|nr:MAG: hypothetical protein M1812_001471 [Candelaria pacifica]